jgi:hypothetical protein
MKKRGQLLALYEIISSILAVVLVIYFYTISYGVLDSIKSVKDTLNVRFVNYYFVDNLNYINNQRTLMLLDSDNYEMVRNFDFNNPLLLRVDYFNGKYYITTSSLYNSFRSEFITNSQIYPEKIKIFLENVRTLDLKYSKNNNTISVRFS